MKLERLRLKNFCQHKDLDWSFQNGIVAILGPNGSGKSNAVKAAYAALTGDFKRNEGVTTDNICKTSSEKDESFVELTFSTSGNVATITRNIRPNKRSLVINGGSPITSEKEIATAIEGLIGVNSKILDGYIFVDQWKMFEVFSASKSERMTALQYLYGLGKAEVCYDEISKISGKINIQLPSESIEDIDALIREKNIALDGYKLTLSSIKSSPESTDSAKLQEHLKVIRQVKSDKTMIESLNNTLVTTNAIIKNLESSMPSEPLSLILGDYENMEDINSEIERIDGAIKIWKSIQERDDKRKAINIELDRCTKAIEELGSPPEKPKTYYEASGEDLNKYNNLAGLLSSKIACLSELKGKNECPVCKSSGDILEKAIELMSESINELKPIVESMKADYDASRAYDSLNDSYSLKLVKIKSSMTVHSSNIDELNKLELLQPTKSASDCESERLNLCNIKRKYEDTLEKISSITSSISFHKGQAASMADQIDKLQKSSSSIASLEECIWLETTTLQGITAINENKEKLIRTEESIKACQDTIEMLEDRKKRISMDLEEAKVNKGVKEHLDTLKDVLHRTNLPRKVAVNYLKQTVFKINNYLEDFNAAFRIYSDDELVFWAKFDDGRDLPASRLSGGEKGLLSMAFRLAVQFGVAANVNLLVLDEPTVGLDDDNVECLETAFNRLRSMARSSGMQVLIVSHEKAIERMCDHTLSLYR